VYDRLISSALTLQAQHPKDLSHAQALMASAQLTLLPQLAVGSAAYTAVKDALHAVLALESAPDLSHITHLGKGTRALGGSHILTPSRRAHAEALMACMTCKLPVLLEGPAAVGKTSLVAAVCSAHQLTLLRISNSESTTLQVRLLLSCS
jgi:hypothetical protein